MKNFIAIAAALSLFAGTAAYAQPDRHDDHHDNRPAMMMKGPAMHGPSHADWRKGGRIEHNDWDRGQKVDYRSHHLARPQRGYEWRQVDGNYVLAAAATGLIASVILASH